MEISDIVKEKTLAFTGHRPNAMHGYGDDNPGNIALRKAMKEQIENYIVKEGVNTFISGMALGVDIWAARIVLILKKKYPDIKLVAAIPCKSHWRKWKNPDDRILWKKVTDLADLVYYVSEEEYTAYCMEVRNRWMVDHADHLLAVYNGSGSGGTYNCIKYAKGKDIKIKYLDPNSV